MSETIVVLDFGSQYSQLIARRIRECHVYSKIMPYSTPAAKIREENPRGIILSGGPSSVYAEHAPKCDPAIFELGIPVLGICYGLQLMIHTLGGEITRGKAREYGKAMLKIAGESDLFQGLSGEIQVWMSHGDKVTRMPEGGFEILGSSGNTEYCAVRMGGRSLYGIQFHPEVVHTPQGSTILRNFCRNICGCSGDWTMESFIEQSVREIRAKVGSSNVILGLSGGVDSSVAAALIHKAIGRQLNCIFVNNGLLRKNEAERVQDLFGRNFAMKLIYIDATDRFLDKLKGVADPEQKRKIIGKEFIDVFAEAAAKIDAPFLGQGTIYPDILESIPLDGNPNGVIKSHHNVGGLPKDMKFKLVEPVERLFKDEVRAVGRMLGLPSELIDRHPFPGPSLGVRHVGPIERNTLAMLREADAIVTEELTKAGWYHKTWQTFAIFVPVKTVGIKNGQRSYDYVIAIRSINSVDAVTAQVVRLPWELLETMMERIVREVDGVNRVVYDITAKPPGTIEWE